MKDGSEFEITTEQGIKYERMFPNINVAQEFCSMTIWLEANESRRKTKRGIKRFIAGWLIKSNRDQTVSSRVAMEAAVGKRY